MVTFLPVSMSRRPRSPRRLGRRSASEHGVGRVHVGLTVRGILSFLARGYWPAAHDAYGMAAVATVDSRVTGGAACRRQ